MATKFVYSMITFNIIYDKYNGNYGYQKITEFVDDIFDNQNNLNKFYSYFINFNKDLGVNKLITIKHIVNDNNIKKVNNSDNNNPKRSYRDAFKEAFSNIINTRSATKQDILLILLYINQIRNNLFHGSKDIHHAIQSSQNNRLKIYLDIVLAVNEIYIEEIENII
ncbi:hypothetical protein [Cetobacterium sp.]|uniref:hypothetical protein n=1 Tax=Cetobacterium sp. TaxID=2071632 RepID=UPI003F2C85CA